jgi:hypothetical protein
MFEDKFAKLPDEPAITNFDIDSSRNNNGLLSARKRKRHSSSKHNSSIGGHTSSMITSSDDGLSSDESSDEIENNRENTLRQLYSLQEQVKTIGNTLTYLIQQTNDRLTLHYKRKMKRNKIKGINSGPLPLTSTTNESNRLLNFSPTLISPNIFSTVQSTINQSIQPPQTATRNASTVAMARKKSTPSLESLLSSNTSTTTTTTNGINQFNNTTIDAYNFGDISPTKQTKTTKPTATKNTTNKSLEPARRGPAPGTGVKRLVEEK